MDFVDRMLEDDIRNNSAWNHRFFIVSKYGGGIKGALLQKELEHAMDAIRRIPGNESAWNYLRGYKTGHTFKQFVI